MQVVSFSYKLVRLIFSSVIIIINSFPNDEGDSRVPLPENQNILESQFFRNPELQLFGKHFAPYLLEIGNESKGQVFDILAVGYTAGKIAEILFPNDPDRVARIVATGLGHDSGKADELWTKKKKAKDSSKEFSMLSPGYKISEEEFRDVVMRHPEIGAKYWKEYFFRNYSEDFDLSNDKTLDAIFAVILATNYHHAFSPYKNYPLINEETYSAIQPFLLDIMIVQIADQMCARNHHINVHQSLLSEDKIGRKYYGDNMNTQQLTPWITFNALKFEYTGEQTQSSQNTLLRKPLIQEHFRLIFQALERYLLSEKVYSIKTGRMIDFNDFEIFINNLHPDLQEVVKNKLGMFRK